MSHSVENNLHIESELRYLRAVLVGFSRIADRSLDLTSALLGEGVALVSEEFGGLISLGGETDFDVVRFEVERIREYYGLWQVPVAGGSEEVGYRSEYLDSLFRGLTIVRSDLVDLSRSATADDLVNTLRGAENYRRQRLMWLRSADIAARVKEEKLRESARREGIPPASLRLKKQLQEFFKEILTECGFRKFKRKEWAGVGQVYSSVPVSEAAVPLLVAVQVDSTPIVGLPLVVHLRVLPDVGLRQGSELYNAYKSERYWKLLDVIVPGFGRYRACNSQADLNASIAANAIFLPRVLPVLTQALDGVGRMASE